MASSVILEPGDDGIPRPDVMFNADSRANGESSRDLEELGEWRLGVKDGETTPGLLGKTLFGMTWG